MPESLLNFEDFIICVDPKDQGFALETHEYMLQNGCKLKMTSAKNGYVVSYQHGKKKRVIMNFVFRKSGLVTRIYGDFVGLYPDYLEALPEKMMKSIEKAPGCKRFESPPRCSEKCSGYVFTIKESQHAKCRYNCFMFEVDDESKPYILEFLEKELEMRNSEFGIRN